MALSKEMVAILEECKIPLQDYSNYPQMAQCEQTKLENALITFNFAAGDFRGFQEFIYIKILEVNISNLIF